MSVFIIAEAGVNHNGYIELAKQLIDVAVDAGADAVKFQTFKTENLVTQDAEQAAYQVENTGVKESQFQMLKRLELSIDDHKSLVAYCEQKQIEFMSTPFDLDSVQFLADLGVRRFKIPSGEITNYPYLKKIGALGVEIIMSTGMATMDEVEEGLNVLLDAGSTKDQITILHATTDYPTAMRDVNLKAMQSIATVCEVKVGYSDHTPGIEVPTAAVAMGASVIEKHFTLDKNMEGPDHKASLEPEELKAMIRAIRTIETALGDGVKRPTLAEEKNRLVARKSLVAARAIQAGERFSEQNLTIKRPGTGMSPMEWPNVLGTCAKHSYLKDELI